MCDGGGRYSYGKAGLDYIGGTRAALVSRFLHGPTHSSCHSNNVGKGYWSAGARTHSCSALHALRYAFRGKQMI